MEVCVRVLAEPWHEVAHAKRVETAYLVFVAPDAGEVRAPSHRY
jgi:acyl-CoA hydrolase